MDGNQAAAGPSVDEVECEVPTRGDVTQTLTAPGTIEPVDEADIAELNAEHMGKSGPTDVLSFPIDGAEASPGPWLLGDVVICPAVARRYAVDHGRSFDDELALLVVHGVLHVLGMDHADPDEARLMQAREAELLEGWT